MQNNFQRVLESMLAEALNKWAVFAQLSILVVLCLSFIIVWKNHAKKETFYWMLAWIMNLIGILTIYLIFLFDKIPNLEFKIIFIIYSFNKIGFAFLLVMGAYAFIFQKSIKRKNLILIPTSMCLLFVLFVFLLSLDIIAIQFMVYLIIGSLFCTGCIYYIKNRNNNDFGLYLFISFILESLTFLHHAWIMFQVYTGGNLPDYMKYVSFFDSIVELILGMACLLSISFKATKSLSENR